MFTEMGMAENISIPVNVGVVLDLDSDLDGKIALSCIEMALSDFYATHGDYRTRLVLNTRDSMKDVVGAAAAASTLALEYLERKDRCKTGKLAGQNMVTWKRGRADS
ncbi:hypothetical protein DKX38_027648 [Salix brachista]|uniref:Uncharacterized protein n=1 Tax=Salix brachista TaxID=2182728 RepID=A0A5N5J4X0_9ROSI|nr:hypothetical protein DKX38_027648 [Salix brachista]